MRIDVYDSPDVLAEAAAARLSELLADVPAMFGLAGGSTPAGTYDILRDQPVPWEQVVCWLPDERWVPPENHASNAFMARRQLTMSPHD